MRRLAAVILAVVIPLCAFAQNVSKQNEAKRRIEEEIAAIDKLLGETRSKQKASEKELSLLETKVASRKKLLSEIDGQIDGFNREISQKQSQIDGLQRELDTLQKYYSHLVYNTYKNRDPKLWFMHIFAAEDLAQGFRRYNYLRSLSTTMNEQGAKIIEARDTLNIEKQRLSQLRSEAEATRAERTGEYNRLLDDQAQSRKLISQLSKNEKQYKQQIAAKKKEIERLNAEIEKAVKAQVKKDTKAKTVDTKLSGKFEQNKGKLPMPLKKGVIVEHYGQQTHPVYKSIKMPFNSGVTFSTSAKAAVYCVFDGVVKQILVIPGYNQCVLVQHGSYFTFYCKLGSVSVKTGQKVSLGDQLGTLDVSDGTSQLHFQIWKGTEKQDPEKWLKK